MLIFAKTHPNHKAINIPLAISTFHFESVTRRCIERIITNFTWEPFICKPDTIGWVKLHLLKLKAAAEFDELGVRAC